MWPAWPRNSVKTAVNLKKPAPPRRKGGAGRGSKSLSAGNGLGHMRLINAIGIFRQVVAGERKCPRPRTAANLLVLADAAFAFPLRSIAQCPEQRRLAIHLC